MTTNQAKILIADDDAKLRQLWTRSLKSHGLQTDEAEDGLQANEISI